MKRSCSWLLTLLWILFFLRFSSELVAEHEQVRRFSRHRRDDRRCCCYGLLLICSCLSGPDRCVAFHSSLSVRSALCINSQWCNANSASCLSAYFSFLLWLCALIAKLPVCAGLVQLWEDSICATSWARLRAYHRGLFHTKITPLLERLCALFVVLVTRHTRLHAFDLCLRHLNLHSWLQAESYLLKRLQVLDNLCLVRLFVLSRTIRLNWFLSCEWVASDYYKWLSSVLFFSHINRDFCCLCAIALWILQIYINHCRASLDVNSWLRNSDVPRGIALTAGDTSRCGNRCSIWLFIVLVLHADALNSTIIR